MLIKFGRNPSARNIADATEGTIGKTAAPAENATMRLSLVPFVTLKVMNSSKNLCPDSSETLRKAEIAQTAWFRVSMEHRMSVKHRIASNVSKSRYEETSWGKPPMIRANDPSAWHI